MKKLDRSRDYGTVFGDTEGRVYYQDGVYFDVNGRLHGAPIYEPPAESIGEEAARLADETVQESPADPEAAQSEEPEPASRQRKAKPADDQVSKQIAS